MPVAVLTHFERVPPTLHDPAHRLANTALKRPVPFNGLKTSKRVVDGREAIAPQGALRDDDLLGVGVDDEIRIVRDDDDLPTLFGFPEVFSQDLVGGLIIEILVWLVDDEGSVVESVDCQVAAFCFYGCFSSTLYVAVE